MTGDGTQDGHVHAEFGNGAPSIGRVARQEDKPSPLNVLYDHYVINANSYHVYQTDSDLEDLDAREKYLRDQVKKIPIRHNTRGKPVMKLLVERTINAGKEIVEIRMYKLDGKKWRRFP